MKWMRGKRSAALAFVVITQVSCATISQINLLSTTAETESELAGVMAHEIGHVVGRHGARQISACYGLAVLLEIVASGPGEDSVAH